MGIPSASELHTAFLLNAVCNSRRPAQNRLLTLRRPSKSRIEDSSYTVSTIGRAELNFDWAGMDSLKVCVPTVA